MVSELQVVQNFLTSEGKILLGLATGRGTNQSDAEAMLLKQKPYSLPNPQWSKLKFILGNPNASPQRCSPMFLQWKLNGPNLTGTFMYYSRCLSSDTIIVTPQPGMGPERYSMVTYQSIESIQRKRRT